MAGSTRIVKENEVLFKFGDPAKCMYIVRKGTLKVFFTKGAEEVQLAVLNDGAIVGEMAFFDNKPRSASVKAVTVSEVTEITRADFDKLLQQVPKWVVTMMQSLSSRLRITNEKLQILEASTAGTGPSSNSALILPHQSYPFQHVMRALRLTMLALSKDGQKEGTSYSLQTEIPKKLWLDFAGKDELELFDKIMEVLDKVKMLQRRLDSTKVPALVFSNRGTFAHFIEFFSGMAKTFTPLKPFLSDDAIALFGAMVDAASESGYETLNVTFGTIKAEATKKGLNTAGWAQAMGELGCIPEMKILKNGNDVTARIYVKEHRQHINYLRIIQAFKSAKLV